MKKYDVVVIGSGPGGQVSSRALAAGGRKVAVVEEDLWGGTCPNRGCDPKKVLVAGMEAVDRSNQLDGKGLSPIRSINWPGLMEFKRTFTDPVSSSSKEGLDVYKRQHDCRAVRAKAGGCFRILPARGL